MIQWLKDHFIPSEANDHQPHFLRTKIVAGLVALIFVVELFYLASSFVFLPTSDYFAAIFASVLVEQTNDERKVENLGSLTVNEKLIQAAQMKADDMATRGYFSHIAPDGKNPWYWFKQVEYNYAAAGENLAVNFTDSKDVTEAWMHSPSHRNNIMGENYTEIGIATAHGTYKGKDAIFVVQMFGRPSLVARRTDVATTTVLSVGSKISTVALPSQIEDVPVVKAGAEKIQKEIVPKTSQATPIALKVPTTTVVAGAETTKLTLDSTSDTFVTAPVSGAAENVPAVVNSEPKPAAIAKVLTSPRQTTNALYLLIAALVTLALGLAVFIKIRIQYPHIIANGLLVLAVVLALLLLNGALNLSGVII